MGRKLNFASNLEVVVNDVENVGKEMIDNQLYHRYVYFITIKIKIRTPLLCLLGRGLFLKKMLLN